ncbi:putative transmembrane protein [Toxoplasma gondii RUB]|uniref:Putative transmembrane protein n=1 Tax=Toxoplasma gondii RUB TaxID=935652 RepID=A0A086LN32_TOXGO|nr:putative transmembrane protein [Toxoplasma gondii RUB]
MDVSSLTISLSPSICNSTQQVRKRRQKAPKTGYAAFLRTLERDRLGEAQRTEAFQLPYYRGRLSLKKRRALNSASMSRMLCRDCRGDKESEDAAHAENGVRLERGSARGRREHVETGRFAAAQTTTDELEKKRVTTNGKKSFRMELPLHASTEAQKRKRKIREFSCAGTRTLRIYIYIYICIYICICLQYIYTYMSLFRADLVFYRCALKAEECRSSTTPRTCPLNRQSAGSTQTARSISSVERRS